MSHENAGTKIGCPQKPQLPAQCGTAQGLNNLLMIIGSLWCTWILYYQCNLLFLKNCTCLQLRILVVPTKKRIGESIDIENLDDK